MKFYLSFYILFYTINLISLNYLLIKMFNFNLITLSISHMLYYIVEFSKLKKTYFSLVVSLVGLPPFLMFFIKFNFLLEAYDRLGFFFFYIMFLTVAYKMFFYIQALITKNMEFEVHLDHFNDCTLSFSSLFFIHLFLFIFFLSVFFLPDLYLLSVCTI
jgi:hypothetical protein